MTDERHPPPREAAPLHGEEFQMHSPSPSSSPTRGEETNRRKPHPPGERKLIEENLSQQERGKKEKNVRR